MSTNSDPNNTESYLSDSEVISMVFKINTSDYKVTLYFIKMTINGNIYYPISVDNSVAGEITVSINHVEAGFVKG